MRVSSFFALASLGLLGVASNAGAAVFASGVVSGQTSGVVTGDPSHALGSPTLMNDIGQTYQSIITPFNAAYSSDNLVGIGGGGQLTLQFPNWVNVGGGNEVGVFTYAFYVDSDFAGDNSNPAALYAKGQASIYVSNDGVTWHAASATPIAFDKPANAYQDANDPYQATAGNVPANFGVPFTHPLSDFNGKTFAQTEALYGTSGGGTWLNLGASGLSQIDYIQFRVPGGVTLNLDAVSVNNNAVGAAVPEPMSLAAIGLSLTLLARRRR